jgi:hypothetical protein
MGSLVLNGATSGSTTLTPTDAVTATLTLPSATTTLAGLTTPSFTTTIGVGGATASSSGSGISFPATQSASSDANTLDDYEEGTWTPTDASGAGLSFTVLDARYTKVGRIVECFAQITYPSTASGSGASVGGLPFTSANTSGGAYGAFTCYTNYSQASWLISSGTTTTQPYTFAGVQVTNSAISGKQFRLVWIYEV